MLALIYLMSGQLCNIQSDFTIFGLSNQTQIITNQTNQRWLLLGNTVHLSRLIAGVSCLNLGTNHLRCL